MRVRVESPDREVVRLPLAPSKGVPATNGDAPREKLLQVGDLAKAAGKSVRAIHHYEELGLLKPDARSKGRFRLYDPAAVTRVRWIGKLHDLGMSLAQIQQVVAAWESAPTPARAMADVRATYRAKLEETRAQIAHLSVLESELEASINYLDTCDSCDPSALLVEERLEQSEALQRALDHHAENAGTCGACQQREREAEPDLVAGIVA